MNEREKIQERLRKKEQEIHGLEERIRTARVYIQALHDVLKLMESDTEGPPSAEAVLKPGSAVTLTRELIISHRSPMHISEILDALGKGSTKEMRASLSSSLAAYVRRGEIFTRPAPNTFGLVELGHTSSDEAQEEPPPGFGRASPSTPSSVNSKLVSIPRRMISDDDEIPF